jgi:hypothetical protein
VKHSCTESAMGMTGTGGASAASMVKHRRVRLISAGRSDAEVRLFRTKLATSSTVQSTRAEPLGRFPSNRPYLEACPIRIELAQTSEGDPPRDTVAIWGCGPVGQMRTLPRPPMRNPAFLPQQLARRILHPTRPDRLQRQGHPNFHHSGGRDLIRVRALKSGTNYELPTCPPRHSLDDPPAHEVSASDNFLQARTFQRGSQP